MERDRAAIDHPREPELEVEGDAGIVVRAVDEDQLDRTLEVACGLRGGRHQRHDEICDARLPDVTRELGKGRHRALRGEIVRLRRVGIDRVDRHAGAASRAAREPDRRLSLPGPDLDDHSPPRATAGEIVEKPPFLEREPAPDAGDLPLDRVGLRAHGLAPSFSERSTSSRRFCSAPYCAQSPRRIASCARAQISHARWPRTRPVAASGAGPAGRGVAAAVVGVRPVKIRASDCSSVDSMAI